MNRERGPIYLFPWLNQIIERRRACVSATIYQCTPINHMGRRPQRPPPKLMMTPSVKMRHGQLRDSRHLRGTRERSASVLQQARPERYAQLGAQEVLGRRLSHAADVLARGEPEAEVLRRARGRRDGQAGQKALSYQGLLYVGVLRGHREEEKVLRRAR